MKVRFRLSSVLLLLLIASILVAALTTLARERGLETVLRQTVVQSETQVTRSILVGLEDEIGADQWEAVAAALPDLQKATLSARLTLLSSTGEVLLDSQSSVLGVPVPATLVTEALRNGEATRWKPGEETLQIAQKIYVTNPRDAGVLFREVAEDDLLTQMRSLKTQEVVLSVLVGLVSSLFLLMIIWLVGFRPLTHIQDVVRTIAAGDLSQRVDGTSIFEFDQLGKSVNRMLDLLEQRHGQMGEVNRRLEQALAAQQVEAEHTSHDLSQRAAAYEAVTAIFNAATTSIGMRDLAETALQQIQRSSRADYAWIALFNEISLGSFLDDIHQRATSLADFVHDKYNTNLLVPDWLSPDLPDDLDPISRRLLMLEIRATASVSVRAGQTTIGRIDLASKQPNFWSDSDFALIEWMGQQLGLAISRLDDYQASLGYSELLSRLVELSSLLNRPLSLEEVIATIGKGAVDLSGAQRVAVFQREANGELTTLWQHNLSRRLVRSLISRTRSEPAYFLPVNPVPYMVADVSQLPEDKADWWQMVGLGIRGYASWPLAVEEDAYAVVVCFHERPIEYSQIQMNVLDMFSRQAAIALRNARLLQSEHKQRLLAEALRDITGALAGTLDLNEVIERILTNLDRVLQHDSANIMMLSGDMLTMVRSRGEALQGIQSEEWRQPISMFKILETARDSGRAICVPDTAHESAWVVRPEAAWVRSYATAPIRTRGKVVGFVNLNSHTPNFYSSKDANLLQAFADQASIAMENANLFARTRAAASESSTLLRALDPLLSAGNDLATAGHMVTQAVVHEFSQAHCTLLLVDKERNLLRVFSESGKLVMGSRDLPMNGPGITVTAAATHEVIYASDVSKDPRYVAGASEVCSELAIPLITGGEVMGVLNVESLVLDAFNEASRRLLRTFADRAAWVISNALLFDKTRERARQMTLLNEITETALAGGIALGAIVRRTAALLQADGCYMTRWDEAHQQTIPLVAYGPGEDIYAHDVPEPGERNLTFALMERGEPIAVEDLNDTDLIPRAVVEKFPVRSLLGVPLQVNGNKLGALLVGFNHPYRFIEEEIAMVRQAGGQIALILARQNALVEAQKRAEQSERLRQASAALTTTLDVGEVVRLLVEHLASLIQYDTLLVCLTQSNGLKPIAQRNLPQGDAVLEMVFPLDDPLYMEITHNMHPLCLADAQQDSRFANWGGTSGVHSWLGIPMTAGNEIVGVINLGRYNLTTFSDDELLLAQVLSNQAGVALQNALLLGHQQQLAMTDPLTSLYNRRGFLELAHHELERSRRFNRPLSMMMIDVDHFKAVNDQYGHAAGDDVLRELAERFRAVMRESDLLCRYGGEEFCFLLPESEGRGLLTAGQRVLEAINSRPFTSGDVQVNITVSIGVTDLAVPSINLKELIRQADEALYQAKENGRNRVVRYSQA